MSQTNQRTKTKLRGQNKVMTNSLAQDIVEIEEEMKRDFGPTPVKRKPWQAPMGPRIGRPRTVEEIHIKIAGRIYRWGGMFGSVLSSHERTVDSGDVRLIAGVLFEARRPECTTLTGALARMFRIETPVVHWTPVEDFGIDWIHAFKAALTSQN